MTNVRTIHVDWYNQRSPSFHGGPQLAYQGDHLSNMVVFDNAPELPNYYLLVKMKTDDAGPVVTLPEILLEGAYWVIPNYYTQICQQITYQVCCKTESGDYEHHSAEFKGTILPVIKHDGEPVDQSTMFDPYMDILDERVNELVVAAGDIQIDTELKSNSVNPVQNKIVKENIDGINERLDQQQQSINSIAALPVNLFNDSTYVEGYYIDNNTGEAIAYTNWGYFTASVTGGEKYYLTGIPVSDPSSFVTIGDLYIGYYNGETFVSGQRVTSNASDKSINVPSGANVAKISSHNYSLGHGSSASLRINSIMFIASNVYASITSPDDYVPYTAGRTQIKESALPDSVLFDSDLDSYDLVPAIETYFRNEVTETVNTVLAKSDKPCTVLSVVTDSHVNFTDTTNLRQSEDTFNNLRTVNQKVWCDGLVHLGDLLVADDATITQEMLDRYLNYIRTRLSSAKDKLFITQGNHDGKGGSVPQTQNYNSLGKFNSAYVVRDGDNPYFYVDFENPKVRLIFLALPQRVTIGTTEYNYWGLYTHQLKWFGQVALNVDDGRDVIICSHIGTQSSDFRKNKEQAIGIVNAFNSRGTFDVYYENTSNLLYTADYTNYTKSKIVVWLCGHEHYDWNVPESISGLTFPLVTFTCSRCFNGSVPASATQNGANAPQRTDGTASQDAWTVFIYNKDDKKLSFIRFGAGEDFEIDLTTYTSFQ